MRRKERKRRERKKAMLFLIILVFAFSMLKIGSSFAGEESITIKTVELLSMSGDTTLDTLTFENGKIISNVQFHKVGDSVTYKVIIKNNDDKEYAVKDITVTDSNEYISYEFLDCKGQILPAKGEKTFELTEKYVKEIEDLEKRNQKFDVRFNIEFDDQVGNYASVSFTASNPNESIDENAVSKKSVSPKTGDDISVYIIVASASAILLVAISGKGLITKKYKAFNEKAEQRGKHGGNAAKMFGLILAVVVAYPVISKAVNSSVELTIDNDVLLMDKLLVTYELDENKVEKVVKYKELAEEPEAPDKEGVIFDGWYEQNNKFDFSKGVIKDTDLVGKYTTYYTIVFNPNTVSAPTRLTPMSTMRTTEVISIIVKKDEVVELPKNSFTRKGYKFIGWNTEEDGSGTFYEDEELIQNIATDGVITLYAQWEENVYTIEYDANGGTGNVESQKVKYSEDVIIAENAFEYPKFKFVGWNTESDGSGDYYEAGFAYNSILESGKITLYAQWEEKSAELDGNLLNIQLKEIAEETYEGITQESIDKTIRRFIRSDTKADDAFLITPEDSAIEVYAWFDDNYETMYYYSDEDKIKLSSNASFMFENFTQLEEVDLTGFDTSNVTTMRGMFYGCESLKEVDLSTFDTSNVKSLRALFYNCHSLESVEFGDNFDTTNVTQINHLFYECNSLKEVDLSRIDTSKATSLKSMFCGCGELTEIDVTGFKTENVKDMSYMFYKCGKVKTLDVSNFRTPNLQITDYMFGNKVGTPLALTEISGLGEWDMSHVTSMVGMFSQCWNIHELPGIETWNTSSCTTMSTMFQNCLLNDLSCLSEWNLSNVTSISWMFNGSRVKPFTTLEPLKKWDVSNVTEMISTFETCGNITDLKGLETWNTSKVTDMNEMFLNCKKLTDATAIEKWDISNVSKTVPIREYNNPGVTSGFYKMFGNVPTKPTFRDKETQEPINATWDKNGTLIFND